MEVGKILEPVPKPDKSGKKISTEKKIKRK